jgi:hypothetical protein
MRGGSNRLGCLLAIAAALTALTLTGNVIWTANGTFQQ